MTVSRATAAASFDQAKSACDGDAERPGGLAGVDALAMQTQLRRDNGQPAVVQPSLRPRLAHQAHRPLPELIG